MTGLLGNTFTVIGTAPCEITFTNSSRFARQIEVRCGATTWLKRIEAFGQSILNTSNAGPIEALQLKGKTVGYEVKEGKQ